MNGPKIIVVYRVPNLEIKVGHTCQLVSEIQFWVSLSGWLQCSVPMDQQTSTWFNNIVEDAYTRLPEAKRL